VRQINSRTCPIVVRTCSNQFAQIMTRTARATCGPFITYATSVWGVLYMYTVCNRTPPECDLMRERRSQGEGVAVHRERCNLAR
jgi:hypothetical protein